MIGKNVDVIKLSKEEAVDYIQNRCKNCSIHNDCNGADVSKCNENVENLKEIWRK